MTNELMGKGWTRERKQKARETALRVRPWEKSTGPRSNVGKERSRLNALKHGMRSAEAVALRKVMVQAASLTDEKACKYVC